MQAYNVQVTTQKNIIFENTTSSCNLLCCLARAWNYNVISLTLYQFCIIYVGFANNFFYCLRFVLCVKFTIQNTWLTVSR